MTLHREVGRRAVVRAPFADGADQVGLGGLLGHGGRIVRGNPDAQGGGRAGPSAPALPDHLRMPRSAEVRRLGKGRPREQALGVFHQRRGLLGHLDAVVVEAPEQRRDGDVEHRVVVTQHVLVLGEHRRDLQQRVAHQPAGLFGVLLVVALQRVDVAEQLLLEAMQEQPRAGAHDRVRRHQLRDAESARRCTR